MKRMAWSFLALVILTALLLLMPLASVGLDSHPRPATDYAAALRLVDSLRAADGPEIAPECRTELLSHGGPARHVVVLFHGLTNCPAQFDSLGGIAFARGANVLIPRLPRHGLADHMTQELGRSDARELCDFTDRVLDAAHGLGDSITVVGLSVGGTLAAWAAQERSDVDRAVLIAPMLGVERARGMFRAPVTRLMQLLPNAFVWWDDTRREHLPGPQHVYPRFSTRSVAATLRVGARAFSDAGRSSPTIRSAVMVTVGGDLAVDNDLNAALVRAWRSRGARVVESYEFPAALHLNHDIVDPEQVGGDPAVTYPVLARLIGP